MDRHAATPRNNPAAATPPAGIAAPVRAYFRPEDIAADRWVHLAALILCTAGIPPLLSIAGRSASPAVFAACVAYAVTLVMLFACSAAFYHVPLRVERRRLRQLDHAAIFLLIAGTCTPFTAVLLHGPVAAVVTALVWSGALVGASYKLARPLPFPGFSTNGYLLLGGTVLVGLAPVLRAVDLISLILIVAGLAIIVLGAVLRLRRSLRYRNSIWHGMVIAGATSHYAAILHGVVLPAALS